MPKYILLSMKGKKVLLPVGTFEVWEQENGNTVIQPVGVSEVDMGTLCWYPDQSFEEILSRLSKYLCC